jgi:enamine deaminase RidA (YjgF/YER057c/UK114 family)
MKSIILFLFIALAVCTESSDFLAPNKPKAALKAAPASSESPLAALQRLSKAFPKDSLCLAQGKRHRLIVKDTKVAAAAKAALKGAKVGVFECAQFLAEHAKTQSLKTHKEAKKEAAKAPLAKPSAGLMNKLKKAATALKKSIQTVAGKTLKTVAATNAVKAIDKLLKTAGKSKEAASELATHLARKANQVNKAVIKLVKKAVAKAARKAPANVAKAVAAVPTNNCWVEVSKLINNAKCSLI